MSNHYHLLVETIDGNLSHGMRQLNGLYTQRFNRCHKQVGHLFQGRYKAILVQKEAHLLELARYIVLNPVRAGMVAAPEQWRWSSYDYCMRDQQAPPWLDTEWLLSKFGSKRKQARVAYARFVLDGVGLPSPLLATRHQLLLGDEQFVEKYQHQLALFSVQLIQIPPPDQHFLQNLTKVLVQLNTELIIFCSSRAVKIVRLIKIRANYLLETITTLNTKNVQDQQLCCFIGV